MGVISYSPLGSGLLTGKYSGAAQPERGRLIENRMHRSRYSDPSYLDVAERFVAHAQAHGVHPASLAVAWVMAHPAHHRADHRRAQPGAVGGIACRPWTWR